MSIISIGLNLLLAVLLAAALVMGWRLNRRLRALRDSHDGFAVAVRELNAAAARAEQGLADLRAATDEAIDTLADRIDKGRALAAKLERLTVQAPTLELSEPAPVARADRRLGTLLSATRDVRIRERQEPRVGAAPRPSLDDDLFEANDPNPLSVLRGGRR